MRKRIDPAQAKAKKQKRILIVGGIVLVALLAFQLPKLMKQNKAPETAPAVTTPAEAGTRAPERRAALASAPGDPANLPNDPDPAPVPQEGQLVSFNLFSSKDPFAPQLSDDSTGGSGTTGSGEPQTPPPSAPPETPPASEPPTTTPPVSTPPATTPPASEPPATEPPATEPPATEPPAEKPATSATISVNGISEAVKIGDAFPKANPLFRLLSIKDGVAKIAIAGGSLQDGSEAVSLTKDEPLTLMNTADGTKYVIRLVSVSSE
jgi:cell division septation protein DedD